MGVVLLKNKMKQMQPGQEAPRQIALHRMIPNMMTLMAMAAGLTAIQFALNLQWEKAIFAILLAAILDTMDGATARLLKATSDFGAQLDSLCDFLSFGVAPAIIMYAWVLEESGKIGWVAMIFYASATALRLARFNIERKSGAKWREKFFSGIPSPAGAGLALLPVILWMQYDAKFFEQFKYVSPLVGIWVMIVASLMISRVPTFSIKSLLIPSRMSMPLLAATALLIAALVHIPWPTLTFVGLAYVASIPFSVRYYRKLEKEHANDPAEPVEALPIE